MKKYLCIPMVVCAAVIGCARKVAPGPQPTAFGSAVVQTSGDKQIAAVGATLEQPVVVQVNDAQGNAVPGALVQWHGPAGVSFDPAAGVTDASGQLSSVVTLGAMAGRYRLTASSRDRAGKVAEIAVEETALGYQQQLGQQINLHYCVRCHDPESTPERVSNIDNLDPKPHAFADGDALNHFTDADLTSIITHGGAALNKSPQMPPFGFTLSKSDVEAVVAYIRAIQDPPYQTKGLVYAQK